MRSKEKLQRAGLIGLAVATNFLAACGDRGPTQEDRLDTLSPEHTHDLILDHDPIPTPTPALPIQRPTILPNISEDKNTSLEDSVPKIIKPTPAPEVEFNKNQLLDELENEKNKPKYTKIDWDSLNLIDKEHVNDWTDLILKHANHFDIPPEVIATIIDTESHGRTDDEWKELPGDGAGLMGVMPNDENNTFPRRPDRETLINNHDVNISYGTAILSEVYNNEEQGNGNWYKTFLWYNAGLQDRLKYAVPYSNLAYSKLGWEISEDDIARLMGIEDGVYNNERLGN